MREKEKESQRNHVINRKKLNQIKDKNNKLTIKLKGKKGNLPINKSIYTERKY